MRKFLTTVIVIALFVLWVVFAVANRHDVTVSFDPFNSGDPALTWQMPLFAVIIAAVATGVLAGGFATWVGQRHWRRAARRHRAEAEAAKTELVSVKSAALAAQGGSQRLPAPFQAGGYGPYGRDKRGAAL
ncbi:lipopolysaccharide assembly protein LapA domain-containing protein [Bradyrhizobium sp. STM 3557]|uniref:lipopolysaccharide assembly protein LapA domain-containing protein n=1 Tax=Bradyrhizobium sp. STM 3557 TaxID=578920 RepID=UPI00388D7808